MKKIMILGSIKYFENIVRSAKDEGIYTIVCDNRENTPAKEICDKSINVDLLNLEELKKVAIEENIDGIITSFSDALMEPYVYLANELNLPCVIEPHQLKEVTNKAIMKEIFEKNKISHVNSYDVDNLDKEEIKYPVIIKPVDNSGSKGIYIANNYEELKEKLNDSKVYSNSGNVIIEEFYENEEIQGLAWVNNGEVHVIYIGDRSLVDVHEGRPGKPEKLFYPSKYCFQYKEDIEKCYKDVASAFNIKNGPIYMQMLVGSEGLKVSEMMTRLPGGCDYLAVKQITGFDPGRLFVNFSVGNKINFDEVKKFTMNLKKCAYALPIYLREGNVSEIVNLKDVESQEYVSEVLLKVKKGDSIKYTGDLRDDYGRIFGTGKNIYDAQKNIQKIHELIDILDENKESMIDNF